MVQLPSTAMCTRVHPHAEVLDVGDDLGQVLLRATTSASLTAPLRASVVRSRWISVSTPSRRPADLRHPELDPRDVGQGVLLGGAAAVDGRLVQRPCTLAFLLTLPHAVLKDTTGLVRSYGHEFPKAKTYQSGSMLPNRLAYHFEYATIASSNSEFKGMVRPSPASVLLSPTER